MNTHQVDSIEFDDPQLMDDLGRYATRAKALDDEAGVRLQATPGPDGRAVLAAWVGVLPGSGILGEGLVLGLRTFALATPVHLDITVPAKVITDRTARGGSRLALPPVQVAPDWTAITPPRSGWEYAGLADGDDVAEVARQGLEEVSAAVKERGVAAGLTKQQVWARSVTYTRPEGSLELAAGVALAAYALGFLTPGAPVQVYRTNRWTRVTGPGGHVLAR